MLNITAKEACELEATFVRKLLEDIDKLRKMKYDLQRGGPMGRGELMQMLAQSARTAPLWIGPPDTHPPALVGAIPAPVSMCLKVSFCSRIGISSQQEAIEWFNLSNIHCNAAGWYGGCGLH